MRLGFETTKPRRHSYLSVNGVYACPIGAAAKAVGLTSLEKDSMEGYPKGLMKKFPILQRKLGVKRLADIVLKDERASYHHYPDATIHGTITMLFDIDKWSREQVADLVEKWDL